MRGHYKALGLKGTEAKWKKGAQPSKGFKNKNKNKTWLVFIGYFIFDIGYFRKVLKIN